MGGDKARRLQVIAKCGLRQARDEMECCRMHRCVEVWVRQLFSENEENLTYNIEVLLEAAKESTAIIEGNKAQEDFNVRVREEKIATVESQALRLGTSFGWWAATAFPFHRRLRPRVQVVPIALHSTEVDLDLDLERIPWVGSGGSIGGEEESYRSEAYDENEDEDDEEDEDEEDEDEEEGGEEGVESGRRRVVTRIGNSPPPSERSVQSDQSKSGQSVCSTFGNLGHSTTRSFQDEAEKRLSKVRWTTKVAAGPQSAAGGEQAPPAVGNIQSSIANMINVRNAQR